MTAEFSSAYPRFLDLSRALTELGEASLSANERALLEAVALAWHGGTPMTVRRAISVELLGSPATLHKRLTKLRVNNYLAEMSIEGDRRTKLLIPTQKALEYFAKLGSCLTPQSV